MFIYFEEFVSGNSVAVNTEKVVCVLDRQPVVLEIEGHQGIAVKGNYLEIVSKLNDHNFITVATIG